MHYEHYELARDLCCIFPEKAFQIGTYEYMRSNDYSLLQSSIAASTMQCVISTPRDLAYFPRPFF